ncbi:MAG TPA: DNA methyltransferase [Verrucomicrobiae bacterium]|nr:DNA methyltransferase [Verrucomicrobiae bacterium]
MKKVERSKIEVPKSVVDAILNQDKVDEPPHSFYKYPARFSPVFAREAIKAFTREGHTVLDCFCGGGTSLVEAIALGRRAVGFDISSLAVFLARTKTAPISVHDKRDILRWAEAVAAVKEPPSCSGAEMTEEEAHYRRNLPDESRSFFEAMVDLTKSLPKVGQQSFARLALLGVGQWALDCKDSTPSWGAMQSQFLTRVANVVENHFQFAGRAAAACKVPRCRLSGTRRVINRSCEDSSKDGRVPAGWLPAKLVLTSPPYPGVHVLYHRWQVKGRRETPAPFWLAGCRDGAGASYYCLGHRGQAELKSYFERLGKAFTSVSHLVDEGSLVVQLVAFSQPEWQLPAYLKKMEDAGFVEVGPLCNEEYLFEGRIWRDVPGRKWYAKNMGRTASSQEVLLLHRKRVI